MNIKHAKQIEKDKITMASKTECHLSEIEIILKYNFKDRNWLECALTHASVTSPNYERLEFLGDRVLGLAVSEIIFKKYPDENEGDLARRFSVLVCKETLAEIGRKIGIDLHIFSLNDGIVDNENIIADVMESLLGAMYIDGGFEPCQHLIEKHWAQYVDTMTYPPRDPKTELQEWAQGRGFEIPNYEIVKREGPDHAPEFTVRVIVKGHPPQEAKGLNRRQAEKDAAKKLLEFLT